MEPFDSISCYTCDKPTSHETQYVSEPEFVGKLLVCKECGEGIKEPLGGPRTGCCS